MKTHKGQIVEEVIRKGGYRISTLAKKLGISRNTLYNRFKEPDLAIDFIIRIGNLIKYDFAYDFPEINPKAAPRKSLNKYSDKNIQSILELERSYSELLEAYTHLQGFLVRMANETKDTTIREAIKAFQTKTSSL